MNRRIRRRRGSSTESEQIDNDETIETKEGDSQDFDGPHAEVEVSLSYTENIGNYESIRRSVTVRIPCERKEVDRKVDQLQGYVEKKLKSWFN